MSDLSAASVVTVNDDGEPALLGSRCGGCGRLAFPSRERCYECPRLTEQDVILPSEGTLYAFSTVHVSSSRATPYTLGFVDLPGDLRVLGVINGGSADLRVGDSVVVAVDGEGAWGFRRKC